MFVGPDIIIHLFGVMLVSGFDAMGIRGKRGIGMSGIDEFLPRQFLDPVKPFLPCGGQVVADSITIDSVT